MRKAITRIALLLLLLLVLVALVPSSTPVVIGNYRMLSNIRISDYALAIAAGVCLAALVSVFFGTRRQLQIHTVLEALLSGAVGALLGARILYCAVMIQAISVDYGLGFIFRLWEGGYTLFGGVWGGIAGIALYTRASKQNLPSMLGVLAPGAAVFLAVARLAEHVQCPGAWILYLRQKPAVVSACGAGQLRLLDGARVCI